MLADSPTPSSWTSLNPAAFNHAPEPAGTYSGTPGPRARHEIGALGHLVLEPPDVGVLWRQLDRLRRGQHRFDGVLGLAQRGFPRVDLEREDRGQARLHLRDRIALEHVDRHGPVLGL